MADGFSTLYYVFAAAAAGASAYASYEGGKAQKYEYQSRAEEEKLAARDREIARRNKLLKSLAERNVASAAGGTALEGTDIALINRDLSEYSLESLSSEAMTAKRVSSLKAAGKNAKRLGTISAAADLFQGASAISGGFAARAPGTATTTSRSGGNLGRI